MNFLARDITKMDGHIFQLNCSQGGVPKLPVRATLLTTNGLVGDAQAHTNFHGGPERALCLFALERILELQKEGHTIYPGSAGENVTVAGLDWNLFAPGALVALGDEVLVEISSYTTPCKTIRASFVSGAFERIAQKKHAGYSRVYARVLQTGRLAIGQPVQLLNRSERAAEFVEHMAV